MLKNWLAAGALALTAGMTTTAAFAQTTTIPGEQVGLATGAPLPEGIYALNTFTYRGTDAPASGVGLDTAVNIPVLVWATPFVPLGGRIELLVAPPTVFAFGRNGGPAGIRDVSINVGTFVGGIWAFDLGGNFGVSFLGGAYLNDLDGDRGVQRRNNGTFVGAPILPQLSSNTYRAGIAGSYTGDGYNLTANLTYNFYDSPGRFDGPNIYAGGSTAVFGRTRGPFYISDAFNLDLTATKKFDLFNEGKPKFEIGAIGYGTVNLHPGIDPVAFYSNAPGIPLPRGAVTRGGRFALGGLVGYDFGKFTVQAYVAHDVVTQATYTDAVTGATRHNYTTDGWIRVIVPLYNPPAPAPVPVVTKY